MYNTQVVYVQDDVFVHTSTSVASNYAANIIRGQISIIEKVCVNEGYNSIYMRFMFQFSLLNSQVIEISYFKLFKAVYFLNVNFELGPTEHISLT